VQHCLVGSEMCIRDRHTPSHWQNLKLETGIIEFQVAPFVTVVADIRGARYLLRVWWA
jgi:hypothetical protein